MVPIPEPRPPRPPVPSSIGTFNHNHTPVWLFCPLEKRREATRTYPDLPAITGVFGHHQRLGDSLWDSLFGTPGVQLTDDDIQNMPYASQYMQLNGGPQLFVVLAFSENGQQKWVTQDGATIVTQHGRLVKTLLGGDNLIDVNNLATDPLAKPDRLSMARLDSHPGWTEHRRCVTPPPVPFLHGEGPIE